MKRILLLAILAIITLTASAQAKGTKVLAKSIGMYMPRPDIQTDKKTNKTSAVWYSTNNAWIKDFCETKNVAIEKDYNKLFPNSATDMPYMPMSWMLTDENNETVLHCYFPMPADEVTNLWLTSEETCIVDNATGKQYRIRRTEPNTFRKHFSVKAPKGDVLDLKVYFPPLPETTKSVTMFGIPNWNLVGWHQALDRPMSVNVSLSPIKYDTIPRFHNPRILQEHLCEDKPYDMQNWNTWKVLTDVHLIKPQKDETLAIWLTPETTYVAIAYEQNWTREYFTFSSGLILLDEAGHQYKLRKVQGVPLNELFFMEGNAGDYIAFLMEFDPLPLDLETITYIEPDIEPFNAWGANNKGTVLHNLNIQQLRQNQRLFDYLPRVIVE